MKNQCVISAAAREMLPALVQWLKGAWLDVAQAEQLAAATRTRPIHILTSAEMSCATYRDIIVDFREGDAQFIPAANGIPVQITFGLTDMAFGFALIAETVRAKGPAIGEPSSANLMTFAHRVAQTDASVLIQGETGTGKEGMARFVHDHSPRGDKPFIAVNCAALPETMIEAILFGHKRGAFTGASGEAEGLFRAANGGSLFLDEITELPLPLQAKLLRVLQEGEVLPVGETRTVSVDVRIIAAANRDFEAEVAQGRFREDLYWRLNVVPINLPRLRERRQDIRAIAAAMLLHMQDTMGGFAWLSADALETLMAHNFQGNARELNNILQRAMIMRNGDQITSADLQILPGKPVQPEPVEPEPLQQAAANGPRHDPLPDTAKRILNGRDLQTLSREIEFEAIRNALNAHNGNRRATAEMLGISERTLRYRLADMRDLANVA